MIEVYLGRYDTFVFGSDSRDTFRRIVRVCDSKRPKLAFQSISPIRESISYVTWSPGLVGFKLLAIDVTSATKELPKELESLFPRNFRPPTNCLSASVHPSGRTPTLIGFQTLT